MKVLALILCLLSLPAHAGEWQVVSVIDGDTLAVWVPLTEPEKVRLRGVDTPESGRLAKCDRERLLAAQAKAFTAAFLSTGPVTFSNPGRDKYGRILATVTVGGQDLAQALIRAGLGRPYDGGRRGVWC